MNFSEHLLRKRGEKKENYSLLKQLGFPLTMCPDAVPVRSKCSLSMTVGILFIMSREECLHLILFLK